MELTEGARHFQNCLASDLNLLRGVGMDEISMNHSEGSFRNQRGLNIFYHSWEPQKESRAVFVVAHGIGEHCGRYLNLVNYFVPHGIAVFAHDHQGHGKSEGKRGCVAHFVDFVEDFHQFRLEISNRIDNLPLFVVGHSMGGLIAFKYLLEHGDGVTAGILSSPAFEVAVKVPAIKLWMGKLFSRIAPNVTMSNGIDPKHLCRDSEVVDRYINDPLVHDQISGRLFCEMLETMAESKARVPEVNIPLLMILGGQDKLTAVAGSKSLFERVGAKEKKLFVYPESYHELFNEPDKEKVFDDMWDWLETRL